MKANKKREYIDNRNWPNYNEELIMRGYFYFNPKFLDKWNEEVKQMNSGKVGEPYLYPESMIKFLAILHCRFDFRGLEGFMRWLSETYKYRFPIISYSQISRRYNALKIDFKIIEEDMEDYLEFRVDGSGEKSTKRGGWRMKQEISEYINYCFVVIAGILFIYNTYLAFSSASTLDQTGTGFVFMILFGLVLVYYFFAHRKARSVEK